MEPGFKKIYIEIGNICNLQCSFCPAVNRSQKRLTQEELRHALLQAKPFTERVCFHLMGEPLSHPEFPAFIDTAAEVNLPVEITTNGTLLTSEAEAALLHPIVAQVNFSLQSFQDNFPTASQQTYLSRILTFTQRALETRPDLYINFRLWNLTAQTQTDQSNEPILQRIEETLNIQINRRVDPRLRKSKRLKGRLYLHYDTRFEWPGQESPNAELKDLRTKGTCHGTRSHIGVHADGTVVPCCLDKEADIPLGNIQSQPLNEILQSPRFQAMKKGFEKGILVEELCQRCTFATRFS